MMAEPTSITALVVFAERAGRARDVRFLATLVVTFSLLGGALPSWALVCSVILTF
jgi:hypothetical protein